MRRRTKLVAFALATTAPLAVAASSGSMAGAASGMAISVNVTSATLVVNGGPAGDCAWEVRADVIVVNLTGEPQRVTAVDIAADWTAPGGANGHSEAIPLADGGLYAGVSLDAMSPNYFVDLLARMTIRCSTTHSQLEVGITDTTGQRSAGDDPFTESTRVQVAASGGWIGPAAIAVICLVAWQRSRRLAQTARHGRGRRRGNRRHQGALP